MDRLQKLDAALFVDDRLDGSYDSRTPEFCLSLPYAAGFSSASRGFGIRFGGSDTTLRPSLPCRRSKSAHIASKS
jgi:hypothetical protein